MKIVVTLDIPNWHPDWVEAQLRIRIKESLKDLGKINVEFEYPNEVKLEKQEGAFE